MKAQLKKQTPTRSSEAFSKPTEAFCLDRQAHFAEALIGGKQLRPNGNAWTYGDLIGLAATVNHLMDGLPSWSEEEFAVTLSEIFGSAARNAHFERNVLPFKQNTG